MAPAVAQRVQFPSPTQPAPIVNPYTTPNQFPAPAAPPTYVAPAAPPNYAVPASPPPTLANPYPATTFGAPTPTGPLPTYAPPNVGPPPAFDPYAVGGSVTPLPPPTAPYTYTPPPAPVPYVPPSTAPFAPVPQAPLTPAPAPFQYQPAPYDMTTSGESYWAKTQRFLQELSFEYTYLYGKHTDPNDFELSRAEVSSTFAFPMFYNIETPLLVTPGFAFNWLEGPLSEPPGFPDLPPQLYDAYLDLAWYPRYNQWLGAELGFRTGVYSDFDYIDSDSLRFMGRGAANVAIAPDMDVVFGAVYLDRVDIKILPVVGVYYRPTPDWDIYAVFPNPKIRRFMANVGTTKWWWYAAGEYGGGSWTVARDTVDDRIDYNDIRVIGGLEWETQTQIRGHVEVGYVFDREIIFTSGAPPNFTPDDTIMLRAGIDF